MKHGVRAARVGDLKLTFDREPCGRCAAHDGLRRSSGVERVTPARLRLPDTAQPRLAVGERAEVRHRQRVVQAEVAEVGRVGIAVFSARVSHTNGKMNPLRA